MQALRPSAAHSLLGAEGDVAFQAASLGGPLTLGATMGSFTVPQSLRIARAISNATSIPADVAHHAVSQALMQPGTHGSGSGGSDRLPSPAAIRGTMKRDSSKRERTSPLKNASNAGKHKQLVHKHGAEQGSVPFQCLPPWASIACCSGKAFRVCKQFQSILDPATHVMQGKVGGMQVSQQFLSQHLVSFELWKAEH